MSDNCCYKKFAVKPVSSTASTGLMERAMRIGPLPSLEPSLLALHEPVILCSRWEQLGNKTRHCHPVFGLRLPQGQSNHQQSGGGVWESNPPFNFMLTRGKPASTSPKERLSNLSVISIWKFAAFLKGVLERQISRKSVKAFGLQL